MSDPEAPARVGSTAELSQRMGRIEARQDDQGRQITALTGTIERVEQNQIHAEKVNDLQFKAMDTSIKTIATDLKGFMGRIEALISGEVQLPQQRELMQDWKDWRREVNGQLDQVRDERNRRSGMFSAIGGARGVIAIVIAAAAVAVSFLK